ncbi:hypothetical protein HOY34_08440 [Xinfangfangia sp. D13-10-4-6]|nr:hypothetical protein [Pseudogemmobacter hezensis]
MSLLTFWRYLLALPFLVIASAILLMLSFIPLLGTLMPGAFAAGFTLVGLRCALAARGYPRVWQGNGLFTLALAYSAIMLLGGLIAGYAQQIMQWAMAISGFVPDREAILREAGRLGPAGITIWVVAILPKMVLATVLIVPMTAAAAARDWRNGGLLFGLGAGTFGLMVPLLAWAILGNIWAFFGEITNLTLLLASGISQLVRVGNASLDLLSNTYFMASFVGMAWASSWFFTTAVLYWERAVKRHHVGKPDRVGAERVSSDDIRALRLSRE